MTQQVFLPKEEANPLTVLWLGYVKALGFEPCEEIRGDFVTKVRRQLKSQPFEAIRSALDRLAQRGQPIRLLPEFVVEARVKAQPRTQARTAASEFIRDNGWPTGARFVRGASGAYGSYVYDPLGLEPLPPGYQGWPHGRPTFDEIVEAL